MQRRGRLIVAAAAAVAVLFGCVWLLPGMLDWNRYRDGIAALASQRLGRPVHIGGAVSLQLLPQPILTAADVSVEGGLADEHGVPVGDAVGVDGAGPDGIGLRARALRLRVALGPLLAGKVDARELTLQGPDLRLPWPPPAGALAQRPPPWLTGLQAKIEGGRLQVGGLVFSGIDGTVTTDPDTGTLAAAGVLQASGGEKGGRWQFTARLGRPGRDGTAGLDVSLDGQDRLRDTGGTFSGQIGADGALSGRVAAQLDVAITAGRLDLDAWLPALLSRNTGSLRAGIPTGVDLSAEAATLGGGILRRLRGGVDIAGGVVHVRDVSAMLPGEAALTLSGQVSTEPAVRFDGAAKLRAPDLRTTLRWLGRVLPGWVEQLPPGVLHAADLSARVVADAGQGAVSELAGTVDESRVAGSATVHGGARPGAVVALTLDRLVLDAWLPAPSVLGQAAAGLAQQGVGQALLSGLLSADAEVKVSAGQVSWRGMPLGAVALEAETEVSRVALRRLEAQPLGARVSLSGQVSAAGRLSDGRLDVSAPELAQLRPLLADVDAEGNGSAGWSGWRALLRGPGSLLVLAAGPPEALAGRMTLELGDLRLEAQPVVDVPGRHWSGPVTLHHPGAPRLLETLGVQGTAAWLGDGSLSLVGQADVRPRRVEINGATLSAGSLRGSGKLVLEGRRAFGTVAFETLPLPLPYPRSPEPLALGWLPGWQAGLHVAAAQVLVGLTPVLDRAAADVMLEGGVLSLEKGSAQLAGGALTGSARLDGSRDPPVLSMEGQLAGLALSGPVFGTALDVVAGQMEASGHLTAAGYSPAALLATSQGQATVRVHGGVVSGFDLTAAGAALVMPDAQAAVAAARTALLGGNTSFALLEGAATVERGVVGVDFGLASAAGTGRLSGGFDLQEGAPDLRLALQPVVAGGGEGPTLGERVSGGTGGLVRTPELAGLARWLAERP